jgi:hypothetical protein
LGGGGIRAKCQAQTLSDKGWGCLRFLGKRVGRKGEGVVPPYPFVICEIDFFLSNGIEIGSGQQQRQILLSTSAGRDQSCVETDLCHSWSLMYGHLWLMSFMSHVIHVSSWQSCQFMAFMSIHGIHANSWHLCQFMSIHENLALD